MRPHPSQLPKGARVYLPDEAARKRHVEARLLGVFARWGYREVVTSTFEYADVLATGTDADVQENMFKLVDRETGRLLALRVKNALDELMATHTGETVVLVSHAIVLRLLVLQALGLGPERLWRSEERRVGKECTSWCRSRWSPYH